MLESLDGPALRRWMRTSWLALGRERAEIDALNVFPVADSDTGTNLHLTVEAVVATTGADDGAGDPDAAAALAVMARGALVGARGNSGVILAQFLRGMAAGYAGARDASAGPQLAAGLAAAATEARVAVAAPVDGTVLSVADAAAAAAIDVCARPGCDLATVADAAAAAARVALARTPSQLQVLADAGVVDAGGRGLLVILEALVATVTDDDLVATDEVVDRTFTRPTSTGGGADRAGLAHAASASANATAFEVMYTLETGDDHAAALRGVLDDLGDSVVVSGGDGLWAVHVHLDDAGAAVEAGLAVGSVSGVRVTPLSGVAPGRAVVVVAPGDGLATLLTRAGATVLRVGRGLPTVADVTAVVCSTGAGDVVLLPSSREVAPVAEAAARSSTAGGPRVRVLPTRAVVQSLAALAVHDPSRAADDDVVAMTAAATATRYGALMHATRVTDTAAGPCAPGDVLGFVGDDPVTFGTDLESVAVDLVARLLSAGGELVTLVTGAGTGAELSGAVVAQLASAHPGVEVLVYDGGQPDHPLLVGVE